MADKEWSDAAKAMDTSMIALGNQVQQSIDNSGLPVRGFVLVADTGNIEYRTRWSREDFKQVLFRVAEVL